MRSSILALSAALCWPATVTAATYIVRPDGTGDFPKIQEAIAAAAPGDSILLADGTFLGDGNRDLDCLGKAITIRSQSGDPESCVIDCEGTWHEPHRGFWFHSGETAATVLRGVTVANGRTLPVCPGCAGGGILCVEQSSPRIEDCVLRGNLAASSGGGLFCEDSSPTLLRCTFRDNAIEVGGAGGGMACVAGLPNLLQCTFASNTAGSGGGFSCGDDSSPKFWGCLFQDNVGTSDGGGVTLQESSAFFSACTFWGNSALFGGALLCVVCDTVRVIGCTFSGNDAGYFGGGLDSWDSFTRLENTIVAFNTDGRGVYCEGSGSIEASCCDIFGNVDGDWAGCVSDQYGIGGNIAVDPRFCGPLTGDFELQAGSPCAPDANPDCGRIGAWPVGCGDPQDAGPGTATVPAMIAAAPNPFVGGTTITWRVRPVAPSGTSVSIFDVAGRKVRTLLGGTDPGAAGRAWWDGSDAEGNALPGGIYVLRVPAGERTVTERIIKIR